jgi:type IV secretory pathway protease TraF
VILRELTGHTGHRRMAVDLLSMEALDWTKASCLMSTAPDPVDQPQGSGQPSRDRYGRRQPNCRAANRLQSTGRNDNRAESVDSRQFGFVTAERLLGRVLRKM